MDRVTLPSCSDCPAFTYCDKANMEVNGVKLEYFPKTPAAFFQQGSTDQGAGLVPKA